MVTQVFFLRPCLGACIVFSGCGLTASCLEAKNFGLSRSLPKMITMVPTWPYRGIDL